MAAMQKVNADVQERALSVELEDESKLMAAIVRAHEETCDYTRDKVVPLIEAARTQPVFTHCPSQLACPLNPPPQSGESTRMVEDFSERFWPAIRGVVEFAKRIPGFSLLAQDDQVTLLKAGVFEVLLVRLACMFDSRANAMICLNGQVLRRESIHAASNARFLLDSMFDFAERLNSLGLSDNEIGLFGAVVVIAPDRPGIRNVELVHKVQKKLSDVLSGALALEHPDDPSLFDELMKKIPDLRTLNTLHSEKLLAYKMEPHVKEGPDGSGEASTTQYADPWARFACPGSSSPGQSSDWSVTTDSKDGPERFGSPRSLGAESPVRTASFSSTQSGFDEEAVRLPQPLLRQQLSQPPKRECEQGLDEAFYHKLRRVDSPTDSGIESGKEQSGHTPTASLCSSPHSSMEEKMVECEEKEIDDMPVLKRALQAPPLINTTMLMDEAYRHHKKFRAARKDCPKECPVGPPRASLASAHSTLVRTLEQAPRYMNEQQLKRTDLIHTIIMRQETVPERQCPQGQCPQQQQQQQQQQEVFYAPKVCPQTGHHYVPYANSWSFRAVTPPAPQQRLVVYDPSRAAPQQAQALVPLMAAPTDSQQPLNLSKKVAVLKMES